ncbi:rod shape-determining protein MreD [Frigidibacter albus]|uniref:Putative rod shape-determining protein MreD n=1 Tax=Frigidibacter mobilis TaxID=1335048 RepID=A0A165SH13_9RHOB|nr:putative rod shape-determining protein MreD [Frigidibacter mobilis]
MIDPATTRRWSYRALFVALAAALLFVRLLPLSTLPVQVPGPDLILCVTFAWVLRRPDFVPALAIVGVFLIEDMLTMRPPGLWALIVLLGSEFLRDRAGAMRGLPFLAEWATVAAVMAVMLLTSRMLLTLAMVPQVGLGLSLLLLVTTVLAYPLVVAASHLGLGLRPPGEIDGMGSRA